MEAKSLLAGLLILLNLIALLLMLAGVSALQSQCGDTARALAGEDLSCNKTYRYQWWLLVLDAGIQIGVLVAFIRGTVEHNKIALCAFLALISVMLMDNVNTFLILHDETAGDLSTRSAVFSGGCLIAAAAHLSLIIIFGRSSATTISAPTAPGKAPYKTYENEMAAQTQQPQPYPV